MNLGLGVLPGRPANPEYTKGVVDGTYKTELVMNAYARLDIRLVPDLEKELVMSLLRQHLDRRGFQDISVEDARPGYSWSRTEATADIFTALTRACAARGIEPLVWPTMPSTAPFNLFNRSPLQLPIIAFGAGQGAWWHEANEYISVEGIREFMKTMTLWLHQWAEGAPQ
jgi:acetylornithine deacetylase/succinyl-diaminopimelate desuccinylase-like protein